MYQIGNPSDYCIFAGFTIVFGGTLAVLTPDIKQIIAYSTTSQLG